MQWRNSRWCIDTSKFVFFVLICAFPLFPTIAAVFSPPIALLDVTLLNIDAPIPLKFSEKLHRRQLHASKWKTCVTVTQRVKTQNEKILKFCSFISSNLKKKKKKILVVFFFLLCKVHVTILGKITRQPKSGLEE